jgi:starch synthase (maltosyl-transferring)
MLLCYSKAAGDDLVLVVVNLDARHRHAGWLELDLAALGLTDKENLQVHDLLSESRYSWRGSRAYVELDPETMPAHVFRVRRFARREADFEYFA